MKSQADLRKMLNELLAVEDGLSDSAINFIESLSRWNDDFRPRQAEV